MSGSLPTVPGFAEIAREAGRYEVQPKHKDVPAFRVKVLEQGTHKFVAHPEIGLGDASGAVDYLAGFGTTAEGALADLLGALAKEFAQRPDIDESTIIWKARF
ncbi:MAG: hypothetical protein JST92_03570 [Deltaproteobacteria bacterium]|nr:hypothetical protein [Deltaproteobacteria bacterium]